MNKTIGILGLGIFGSTIAKELGSQDHSVIAVDRLESNVDRVEQYLVKGVVGDFTDYELLKSIGIDQCDRVVIATGTSLEASVLAIMCLKKLGVKEIIAKSKNRSYMDIMLEVGATQVIRPEHEMGIRTARSLIKHHILDVIDLDDTMSIIEFKAPKSWLGKTVKELDLRKKYELNVIGIKYDSNSPVDYTMANDTILETGAILVVITNSDRFERLDYLNKIK